MEIYLYNTLTHQKEKFEPINPNEVKMYSCGPTVYSYAHIGNMRAYIFADTLKRMFEYNGFKVNHVMNITDVGHLTSDADTGEDKMEKAARSEGRDPYEDYVQINKELETYNLRLMERPQIIVANKMDMPESQENLKEFKKKLAANYDEFDELPQIFPISSLAHQGLDNLLEATADLLDKTPEFHLYSEEDMAQEEVYYGFDEDQPAFEINRDDDASWILSGDKLEKLFNMTNFDRDESVMKFARQLRGMGVDEALRARGAKDGDIVRIGKFEFEFVD
mgnify:CR=1 FL=1